MNGAAVTEKPSEAEERGRRERAVAEMETLTEIIRDAKMAQDPQAFQAVQDDYAKREATTLKKLLFKDLRMQEQVPQDEPHRKAVNSESFILDLEKGVKEPRAAKNGPVKSRTVADVVLFIAGLAILMTLIILSELEMLDPVVLGALLAAAFVCLVASTYLLCKFRTSVAK